MTAKIDFDELFRSEYPRLVALGLAMTGDRDAARDLAQETMARAHARWADVAHADVPAAWLTRVMKNLLIDRHRRSVVEGRANERVALYQFVGRQPSHDATTERESSDSFVALLDHLPAKQRVIVALHYVDDRSVAEIAQIMEVTTGTVKTQLWKARRTIERRSAPTSENGDTDG